MKLLDKKRIKVKRGELLALNERNMLAKVTVTGYCQCSFIFRSTVPLLSIFIMLSKLQRSFVSY